MRERLIRPSIGAVLVLAIIGSSVVFTVDEGRAAVVTRFGRPRQLVNTPGAHFKLPWPLERAHDVDMRKQHYNTRLAETLTRDKKNVVLRTYVIWSVADPRTFIESLGSRQAAERVLDSLVTNEKNALLGHYALSALVSTRAKDLALAEIERRLLAEAGRGAKRYGISVHQIGLKRLGLPEENLRAVFAQMRQERSKEAARFRAIGSKRALEIRSAADLEVAKIRAKAAQQAREVRGKAEALAARIYAAAHAKQPAFYRFQRALQSLEKMLKDRATLVLRADSSPFDLLTNKKTAK
jgi:membrane protease subunit HflC